MAESGTNNDPVYSETGGISIAYPIGMVSISFSWPFARLNVFEDRLEIKLLGFIPFRRIWKTDIKSLRRLMIIPLFFEGVLISKEHVIPLSWIIFTSFNSQRLMDELERTGH